MVARKGGAREVIAWETDIARLLQRMLGGRKSGLLFLIDRKARLSLAANDVDCATGRARLSYRRAAELFEVHTACYGDGPDAPHQLRHSRLTHAAEEGRVDAGVDEVVGAYLGAQRREVRASVRRRSAALSSRRRPVRASVAGR
ncbi:hypothetical protein [Nocardia beijingensis]|uniref:Tyr recombinase domain-containing protein n=1 Tax=Nocardia beijingensis TaxID=95162 RepID=A0ABW7WT92_9NOCA